MKSFPTLSLLALILANVTVLYFALEGEYAIFSILILYWAESAIMGFFAFLKVLFYKGEFLFFRIITALFFCVHYGGFMLAHFLVILAFTGNEVESSPDYVPLAIALLSTFLVPLIALVASHTVSFITNFIGKREYEREMTIMDRGVAPYERIILMQLTLILGALVAGVIGSSYALIVVMVVLKTGIDVYAHIREHAQ